MPRIAPPRTISRRARAVLEATQLPVQVLHVLDRFDEGEVFLGDGCGPTPSENYGRFLRVARVSDHLPFLITLRVSVESVITRVAGALRLWIQVSDSRAFHSRYLSRRCTGRNLPTLTLLADCLEKDAHFFLMGRQATKFDRHDLRYPPCLAAISL